MIEKCKRELCVCVVPATVTRWGGLDQLLGKINIITVFLFFSLFKSSHHEFRLIGLLPHSNAVTRNLEYEYKLTVRNRAF